MELKFLLWSKTDREDGTTSLRFRPVEGGPTGDLALDGLPTADTASMLVPTPDELAGITHRDGNGTPVPPLAPKKPLQTFTVTVKAA